MELPVHSKLITSAARSILRPAGLFQRGTSRTWLDDNGWWIGVVEFQPSSWSRGSYLNTGCMWLWRVKNFISFDEGHRVEDFIKFQNENKFEMVATSLAEKARQEIICYRQLFPNIHALRKYFLQNRPSGLWPNFHAGVASALDGEPEHARRFFKLVVDSGNDDGVEWVTEAQKDAHQLSIIAGDATQFRQIISERVQQARALQKLAERSDIDFDG